MFKNLYFFPICPIEQAIIQAMRENRNDTRCVFISRTNLHHTVKLRLGVKIDYKHFSAILMKLCNDQVITQQNFKDDKQAQEASSFYLN